MLNTRRMKDVAEQQLRTRGMLEVKDANLPYDTMLKELKLRMHAVGLTQGRYALYLAMTAAVEQKVAELGLGPMVGTSKNLEKDARLWRANNRELTGLLLAFEKVSELLRACPPHLYTPAETPGEVPAATTA
ncbi:MAG: hypothetical protein GC129_07355 [Proteobacteria bacterium]|nr:hypothetical protein [Pseudomonadota bacterium]